MSAFSLNRRRILSLWLPRLPTDRIHRVHSQNNAVLDKTHPCIVVDKVNNALQVVALNDAAAALGLEVQLPLANARAVCPDITVIDADEDADLRALNHVADWCGCFTPLVALDLPHGLLLDISGCAHLFGGEAAMMQRICTSLTRQGFAVSGAIASTSVCARALSRHAHGHIVTEGREADAVSPLPIWTLGVPDSITQGLRRAGLKTIGDVASRTPQEITARFGATFTVLLQQALGDSDSPISPRKPLPDYMVERRFAEPVMTESVISHALFNLSHTLMATLERAGKGARVLDAVFFRTDGAVRTITLETGQPATRAEVVDRLFREKLHALADPLDPGFGFDLLRLCASRTDIVVHEQRDFDTNAQNNDDLVGLIDRIAARIGGERIRVYLPQDTHIPERAAIAVPAQHFLEASRNTQWLDPIKGEPPLRPLRLFDRPEEISVVAQVPDGPPARFVWRRATHAVVRAEGPERIAMEWWRDDHAFTRDYFRVEDEMGLRFWIYRDGLYGREVVQPHWYMHGLFA